MADENDVRRIALALPEVTEDPNRLMFRVRDKHFAWSWLERVAPKKGRVPNNNVLALYMASMWDKDALLTIDPDKFFTEPHYNGYPAVLVRLAAVDVDELEELLENAWRCRAPRKLVAQLDAQRQEQRP